MRANGRRCRPGGPLWRAYERRREVVSISYAVASIFRSTAPNMI
jgi:hypothetical protein